MKIRLLHGNTQLVIVTNSYLDNMTFRKISDNIFSVGSIDFDRILFDEFVALPDGTSYNSYLVKGSEKTALIDTDNPSKQEDFISNLIRLKVDKIDYIVINHAEQDHSGCLPLMLEIFPGAKVLCSDKCIDLLKKLLDVPPERCTAVKDGDTISLGDKTLEFIETPFVHWPETICTYCKEEEILFSCDFFGAHYATSDLIATDFVRLEPLAKRYYAELMMSFRGSVKANIEKIKGKKISLIAPSHGPVINASWIIDKYLEWSGDNVKNMVIIPYVSMHKSTEIMVNMLAGLLMDKGVGVRPYRVTNTEAGVLAMELVDAATVIFATPTVIFGPHPSIISSIYLANLLRPKTKYVSVIGSYGWGTTTVDTIKKMIPNIKAEFLPEVYQIGAPGEKTRTDLDALATLIAEKHKTNPQVT